MYVVLFDLSDYHLTCSAKPAAMFWTWLSSGLTSRIVEDLKETEYMIVEGTKDFESSGLAKTSVVRCEYIMTVPERLVARKLGSLPDEIMSEIDKKLKLSQGIMY